MLATEHRGGGRKQPKGTIQSSVAVVCWVPCEQWLPHSLKWHGQAKLCVNLCGFEEGKAWRSPKFLRAPAHSAERRTGATTRQPQPNLSRSIPGVSFPVINIFKGYVNCRVFLLSQTTGPVVTVCTHQKHGFSASHPNPVIWGPHCSFLLTQRLRSLRAFWLAELWPLPFSCCHQCSQSPSRSQYQEVGSHIHPIRFSRDWRWRSWNQNLSMWDHNCTSFREKNEAEPLFTVQLFSPLLSAW